MTKLTEKIEETKFNFINEEIETDLLNKRFDDKKSFKEYVKSNYKIELSQTPTSWMISDFSYMWGINKEWGYVDIHYLVWHKGLMVTEVNVSSE